MRAAHERARIPHAVSEPILAHGYIPPPGGTTAATRARRREALQALADAGWTIHAGVLTFQKTGAPFRFEIMLSNPEEQRIALAYTAALKSIGIAASVRTIDDSQYQGRLKSFDFDMTPFRWDGTLSPGNEQVYRWGSAAANSEGSYNIAGVADPAMDHVLAALVSARTRGELVTAAHALDRLIFSGAYAVPLFHAPADWIAHSARLARPEKTPLMGVDILTWWMKKAP